MIISIFEKNDFSVWCDKELSKHKYIILEKCIAMLMSTINNKRKLDKIDMLKPIALNSLNEIRLAYRPSNGDDTICNSILIHESILLIYNLEGIYAKVRDLGISKNMLGEFFELLSIYITDATVAHWKTIRNLPCSIIKVENARGDKGFFPISYELGDYITFIERELKKEVVFKAGDIAKTVVKRTCIEIFFPQNRLKCDYLIELQLFDMWLHSRKYQVINRFAFANQSELELSDDILKDAIMYLLQNRYSTLYFSENYNIWDNNIIAAIISFSCSEDSFFGAYNYICRAFKEKGICDCKNLIKFSQKNSDCPIINSCDDIKNINDISLLDTPEKMQKIVDKIFNNISMY